MLARQRSGTGAIASVLEEHPNLFYQGEILDPYSTKGSFFKWLSDRNYRYNMPFELCDFFIEYINTLLDDESVNIIDIKYNSLSAFCPAFYSFTSCPWILDYLSKIPIPMIHVQRRNVVDAYISGKLAEMSQLYHQTEYISVEKKRLAINVDIADLASYIYTCRVENEFFDRFFSGYTFHKTIEYASCFSDDGFINNDAISNIEELLSLSFSGVSLRPKFIKQSPKKLVDKIENIEEVISYLSTI